VPRAPNWAQETNFLDALGADSMSGLQNAFAVIAATAAYDGLHTTASNAVFPTPTQETLWRAASLTVTVSGVCLLGGGRVFDFTNLHIVSSLGNATVVTIAVLGFIWYIFCRVYLAVECFISLAYLSESMLQLPVWSQYIPHIG
jgi:hypothetical protein